MSEENVEVVRAALDAWLRGDLVGVFALYSPTIVWDTAHYRDWPESSYEGHDGVRRFLDEWFALWDEYEGGLDEVLLAPDGRVVVLAWQKGKGRGSGLSMYMSWGQIYTVMAGKVTRIDNYDDPAEALEAAGLAK